MDWSFKRFIKSLAAPFLAVFLALNNAFLVYLLSTSSKAEEGAKYSSMAADALIQGAGFVLSVFLTIAGVVTAVIIGLPQEQYDDLRSQLSGQNKNNCNK